MEASTTKTLMVSQGAASPLCPDNSIELEKYFIKIVVPDIVAWISCMHMNGELGFASWKHVDPASRYILTHRGFTVSEL